MQIDMVKLDTLEQRVETVGGVRYARTYSGAELLEEDRTLADELLQLMAEQQLDFTLTFRRLADLAGPGNESSLKLPDEDGSVARLFEIPDALLPWLARWQQRLAQETTTAGERQASMYAANPVFIPRNHLVEEALQAATEKGDFAPFNTLLEVLARPFAFDAALARFATPPKPEQVVRQTFCGT